MTFFSDVIDNKQCQVSFARAKSSSRAAILMVSNKAFVDLVGKLYIEYLIEN